jgi:hypothetical protein
MPTLKVTGAIGCVSALLAVACAGPSNTMPTSPSAVSATQSSVQVAATSAESAAPVVTTSDVDVNAGLGHGNGNGNGNGGGNGNDKGKGKPSVGGKVEIEGLITAILSQIVQVNGMNILVPLDVLPHHGSHGLVFADLSLGDRVHVRATLVGDQLTATELKLQNPNGGPGDLGVGDNDGDDDDELGDAELKGPVSGRTGECPAITFLVNGHTVRTNSTTVFAVICIEVGNGVNVEVHGLVQPDGSVLATRVEREP